MRKYETVDQCVARIETAFHEKKERDAKFAASLRGKTRTILLDITDGPSYVLRVVNGDLGGIESVDGDPPAKPDVLVRATGEDLLQLFNKELHPVQAYLSKRIRVKAPLGDILFVRGIFGG